MKICKNCTGCSACLYICPKSAIKIIQDKEGFYKAQIDEKKCENCALCKKVCPQNSKAINFDKNFIQKCYAIQSDDEIREKCSSGGVFALLAKHILKNGGVVAGAAFSKDFKTAEHIIVDSEEELSKLYTSKYLQSNLGQIFLKIKENLKQGKQVLFSSTPCHIAGLKSFLNKDYKELITLDILCFGIPSQKVWRKYIDEISNGENILDVNFRSKNPSWRDSEINIKFENFSIKSQKLQNPYYKGFINKLYCAQSCSNCKYSTFNREGDISLGDFWGIEELDKNFSDDKGTSFVLINSCKGEEILKKILPDVKLIKNFNLKQIQNRNSGIKNSLPSHFNRKKFFKNFDKPLKENVEDCLMVKYDGIIVNLWHTNNYGAIISAYAIQQYFLENGLNYYILNYTKNDFSKDFIKDFSEKYLNLTHEVQSKDDLKKLNKMTNVFVAGTDQVFRFKYVKNNLDNFLFSYTDFDKKRIAFSASFGKNNFDEAGLFEKFKVSKFLNRFDKISTREDSGVKILKDEFKINADEIIDPVFLADLKAWEQFKNVNSEKYQNKIVTYILDEYPNLTEICSFLQNKYNLETAPVADRNLSVEEFLSAVKNSQYFITDSFHGACLALIFNKKFVCLINKKRGDARFYSLINKFNIAQCFVENFSQIITKDDLFETINQKNFEAVLNIERKKAKKWLEDAILSEKSSQKDDKIFKFILLFDKILQNRLFDIQRFFEFKLYFKILFSSKKFVFWGASIFLEEFLKKYNIKNKNILGIIDKDEKKKGENFCGYKIFSPDEIGLLKPDEILFSVKNANKAIYKNVCEYVFSNHSEIKISNVLALNLFKRMIF